MKDDAQFSGKKCHVCGSQTLKNDDGEWCSFTGCTYMNFPNLMLEQLGWKPIELIPDGTPVILLLNGCVQHITYGWCGYENRFYRVESDEYVDFKDFTPSHFQELPKAC